MITTKNRAVYEKDICGFNGRAKSIVFPDSIAELKSIIRITKGDIVIRGTGMSFTGACVPNNSVVIDMSKMNRILNIDAQRKLVYVEAGIIIDELNQELERYNLEFPVNPIFSGMQTIGGVIAVNTSGDRELKYGRVRNWVQELEVVDGRGEFIRAIKADASDFVGMEGITGVIARAKLRLTAKKQRTLSILKSDSLSDLFEASKKYRLDHDVSMLEMLSRQLSLMLGLENKYHLFVEYESSRGRLKGGLYAKFFKMKNSAYYALATHGYTLMENPKFFMDRLGEFVIFLEQNNIPYFCNLGSGAVYACFKPAESEKHRQATELIKRLRSRASYSLGIGLTKKEFLDRTERDLARRIKERHDPEYKFNRNKVIDYIIKVGAKEGENAEQLKEKPKEQLANVQVEELIEKPIKDELAEIIVKSTKKKEREGGELMIGPEITLAAEEKAESEIEKIEPEQKAESKLKSEPEIKTDADVKLEEKRKEIQNEYKLESKQEKTAEQKLEEFLEKQKIRDIFESKPISANLPRVNLESSALRGTGQEEKIMTEEEEREAEEVKKIVKEIIGESCKDEQRKQQS